MGNQSDLIFLKSTDVKVSFVTTVCVECVCLLVIHGTHAIRKADVLTDVRAVCEPCSECGRILTIGVTMGGE
jgi:hypothetical protein